MTSKITKKCPVCNLDFEHLYYVDRKYCSLKCFRVRPEGGSRKGQTLSEETKSLISKANKGKRAGKLNPFFGKKHSESTKKKMKDAKQEQRNTGKINLHWVGRKHTEESRQKMSVTRARIVSNGKWNPANKSRKGIYENVKYDSLYEMARLMQLKNDPLVRNFERNSIVVQYSYDNQLRNYTPDFLIHYKDGRIEVEEIKGYESEKEKTKHQFADALFSKLGIQFKVLYKFDIFSTEKEYRRMLHDWK